MVAKQLQWLLYAGWTFKAEETAWIKTYRKERVQPVQTESRKQLICGWNPGDMVGSRRNKIRKEGSDKFIKASQCHDKDIIL